MFEINNYVQIKIKNKDKTNVNKHYNEYENQKGIIHKIDNTWGIRFLLYYEDDSFRDTDKRNGHVYIHEEDVIKLSDENQELIEKMKKQIEEEEYKRKYQWGKCEKCGSPLDMHYHLWCPTCTPKAELVEDALIDMLKCLRWCEVRKEGIKDRVWRYLCDNYEFLNDTIIRFRFEDWLKEDNEYLQFVAKEFSGLGIKMVEFTW